jgi:hypothetical protein
MFPCFDLFYRDVYCKQNFTSGYDEYKRPKHHASFSLMPAPVSDVFVVLKPLNKKGDSHM